MKNLTDTVIELANTAGAYTKNRIQLFKLILVEKLSRVSVLIISSVVNIMMIAFIFQFLAFAFAFWYAQNHGTITEGFLIGSGAFAVIAIVFMFAARRLVADRMASKISDILLSDDEEEETYKVQVKGKGKEE